MSKSRRRLALAGSLLGILMLMACSGSPDGNVPTDVETIKSVAVHSCVKQYSFATPPPVAIPTRSTVPNIFVPAGAWAYGTQVYGLPVAKGDIGYIPYLFIGPVNGKCSVSYGGDGSLYIDVADQAGTVVNEIYYTAPGMQDSMVCNAFPQFADIINAPGEASDTDGNSPPICTPSGHGAQEIATGLPL